MTMMVIRVCVYECWEVGVDVVWVDVWCEWVVCDVVGVGCGECECDGGGVGGRGGRGEAVGETGERRDDVRDVE